MKNWGWFLSGILLGLSFPAYDSIPTGILAWFAFVPFLLGNKEIQSFKIYVAKACLFIIVALLWMFGG
jgi:apolipoprotein N-acyltransferase